MKTKTYKIKVTFTNGTYKYIFANAAKIKREKNVILYCRKKFNSLTIKEIKTRQENYHVSGYHWNLNYDPFFEYAKDNRIRVRAINAKGHEDYSGYGGRTDGKENRFYIGRSTGFIPIYLEIQNSRSTGGPSLYIPSKAYCRTFGYVR